MYSQSAGDFAVVFVSEDNDVRAKLSFNSEDSIFSKRVSLISGQNSVVSTANSLTST